MEFELPLVHRFISPSLESLQGAEVQLPIAAYTERLALLFLFHFGPMRKVNEVLKYLSHWTREKIRVAGHGGHWGLGRWRRFETTSKTMGQGNKEEMLTAFAARAVQDRS
jgi:hypothetical protein